MIKCCILRYNSNKQTQKNNVMNTQNTQNQEVMTNEIQTVINVIEHATKSSEPAIARIQRLCERKHDMNPKQVQKIINHLIETKTIQMITCELGDGWNTRRQYQAIKLNK